MSIWGKHAINIYLNIISSNSLYYLLNLWYSMMVVHSSYNITTYIRTNKKRQERKEKKKNKKKEREKLNRIWAEEITLLSNAFIKRKGTQIEFKKSQYITQCSSQRILIFHISSVFIEDISSCFNWIYST